MAMTIANLNRIQNIDFKRSPAASWVFTLAQKKGHGFFQYESRKQLEEAPVWEAGEEMPYAWESGFMFEDKYSGFRTDLLIASFQPAHSSKWTAHELLHNLLGFSWVEGQDVFYHALASRLSEALPVALFYFFDEVGGRRCERHQFSSVVFPKDCNDCLDLAKQGEGQWDSQDLHCKLGLDFLDREIQAVKRSLSTGRVYENQFMGLNLTTDAMFYAKKQQARLQYPLSLRLLEEFYQPNHLVHYSIDSLITRTEELATALCQQDLTFSDVNQMSDTKAWQMDVAWRLINMACWVENTEIYPAIEELVFDLLLKDDSSLVSCIEQYEKLCEQYELIPPSDLFSVGYTLDLGYGYSLQQIKDGLASQYPELEEVVVSDTIIEGFPREAALERKALGDRLVDYFSSKKKDTDSLEWHKKLSALEPCFIESFYLGESPSMKWNPKAVFLPANLLPESLDLFDDLESLEWVLALKLSTELQPRLFPLYQGEKKEIEFQMTKDSPRKNTLFSNLVENDFIIKKSETVL